MLYKKASDGKIQVWDYEIETHRMVGMPAYINVSYGELNGKIQFKQTVVETGKNIGKKNETNAYQQAVLEGKSKYEKKLKEGYVTTIEAAMSDKVDDIVEGGINPMLAHLFSDHGHKLKYPVYVQPKLDGHRCIAFKENGTVKLWSRKRHEIKSVPHILREVTLILDAQPNGAFLDGELYVHGWSLQDISSAAKKSYPTEESSRLQFHLYDVGQIGYNHTYDRRNTFLNELEYNYGFTYLKNVITYYVGDEAALKPLHDSCVKSGYEGIIIRSMHTPYEYKRSYGLLKMKEMQDDEFPIQGVKSGKDDTVIFIVLAGDVYVDVTMSGSRKDNQKYLTDKSLWLGKYLTVQFQSYTPDGSLLFPVGLQIREDL